MCQLLKELDLPSEYILGIKQEYSLNQIESLSQVTYSLDYYLISLACFDP